MGCNPGLLEDHPGDHAEHPVIPIHMAEDLAVPYPDTEFVGTDQHRIALVGRHVDGVGQVRMVEGGSRPCREVDMIRPLVPGQRWPASARFLTLAFM